MPKDAREFLLKEYDSAVRLTYHADDLRAKLTAAFVALAAAVATATTVVSGSRPIVGTLLLGLSLVGAVAVLLTARLRRVQLEHFRIIDNIRRHFLADDPHLWNVVELSRATLPKPSRKNPVRSSGSYFWVLTIILSSALLAAGGVFLLYDGGSSARWMASGAVVISVWVVLDSSYFVLAEAPPRREYEGVPGED